VGISFKRAASQLFPQLAQRPQTLSRSMEQADRATVIKASVFWGCPRPNYTANLPFDEMRQVFATLLKEIPTPLWRPLILYFNLNILYLTLNKLP
jgi:hypothetical protein